MTEAADASRRAFLAFLAMEPDKLSLSTWLQGAYCEATRFGPRCVHTTRAPSGAHHTTPANIEDLITMSRTVVVAALAAAQRSVDDLVEFLPPVVAVVPAHDSYGNHGFVPVDEARLRLVDRVLALLVADYLTRPDDFQPRRPHISDSRSTHPRLDSPDPTSSANHPLG